MCCRLYYSGDTPCFFRRVLTDLAKEYGIPLREDPKDNKVRGTIKRDWLVKQYVHRRQPRRTSPAKPA
ncbi:hypothetical protein M2163_000821 [Streptomyces sp. SAI-135]|nr:hypothetical protein [Streptomyces sp. SAI-090]MDH6554292.1 hypothetical protein [Streptomyces sp. SAI-041]MDH6573555.1 hypothetical protein [Streptomyces sp. SAI-117]MDH6581709.1 hypothetical protein [Streptomyces sp. SAI-133]MDH6613713.1 hypothetical protein [Streptomyces sp. SAI-135]